MARPKTTPEFNKRYAMLNAEQKKAVDTIEGPVMVIAGPGTGKTQILTLRIANILKNTDASPSAILALTFTEAGVAAMRKRLVSMIGPDGYRVSIYTFHGFCNMAIQRFPEDFPRLLSSQPITDIDQVLLVRELLEGLEHLTHIRPFHDNFAYTYDCRKAISELKREYIDPVEFEKRVLKSEKELLSREDLYHEKGAHKGKMKGEHQKTLARIEKNKELIEVYRAYEEKLQERKLYDYDDMISVVVRELEHNEDVLQRLQEEYQYVLADEHQDANTAQNRLLELLVDFYDNPNLFIVGDEKQAIYRFQGASLENFLYFKKKYPQAVVAELSDSYRSGQEILDASHSMISSDGIERVALASKAGVGSAHVEVREFTTDAFEAHFIATRIEEQIAHGVEPAEIAVLYRTNSDAAYIARALERLRVPYTIESNNNVLDDPAISQLVLLLRAAAHYGEDELLAKVLHVRFLGFQPLDVFKLIKHSRREHKTLYDCIASEAALERAGIEDTKALYVFGKRLAAWAVDGENNPVVEVVNDILDRSGFLTYALNSTRSVEMLEKLHGLTHDIEQLAVGNRSYTMRNLIEHIDLLTEYGIRITKRGSGTRRGVRLMTAHGSKGLEFDYVYIAGVYDTHWGNRRNRDAFALPLTVADSSGEEATNENSDERRLFYVAMTRARLGVFVSYANTSESGAMRLASIFIEEIKPEHREFVATKEWQDSVPPELFLQAFSSEGGAVVHDTTYLRELFAEQGLSVTALNNYLECPWQFFYSNLIRIPKIPNKHMILGTAVHAGIRALFDARNHGGGSKELLIEHFIKSLEYSALSGTVYEQTKERGIEALEGWYEKRHASWPKETLNEYSIATEIDSGIDEMPTVKIQGKLDTVALTSDGVVVYDYKTGSPKSRNHMEGGTKAPDSGNYFRQLVFYKLLLDTEGKYTMKEGVIDFVQPNDRDKYIQEAFTITQDNVDVLRKEISDVTKHIISLDFWDERCPKHKKGECEYCTLRDMME